MKTFRIRSKKTKVLPTSRGGPDKVLALLVTCLLIFGILMIYNASVLEAYYQGFQDKHHFFKLQLVWLFFGLAVGLPATIIDCRKLKKIAGILMIATIILQLMTRFSGLGVEAHGAQRWLSLGSFQIQPSELAKLTLVIYLAAWLSTKPSLGGFLFLTGVLSGTVILGRDLGTAVVIFLTGLAVYFVSGAPLVHFLIILPLAGLGFLVSVLLAPYRLGRILTFLNPLRDPLGSSYHIVQVLLALGSGGVFGVGLGQSRQKYQFIPAVSTDSIFAVIGEELGFLGGSVLIMAYLLLIWRGLQIAQDQPDDYSQLLAFGITAWLGIQALVNLGAMVALLPLTGVPLPFVSYGGSNLIVSLIGVGLLLNLSRNRSGRG